MMAEFALLALIMVLGVGAYWSLVIFPRQRDLQKRQAFVSTLKPGDEVVTYGGILAQVVSLDDEEGIVILEVAQGVHVRALAASVMPKDDEAADGTVDPMQKEQS